MKTANTTQNKAVKEEGGFFTYLKHIFRDPIKSSAEAKDRKKVLSKMLLICLAATIGPVIVGSVLSNVFKSMPAIIPNLICGVGYLCFIPTLVCILMWWSVSKAVPKFENIECSNCNKRFVYNNEYMKYEVLREWEKKDVSTNSNSGRVRVEQKRYVEVGVAITCPDCGTVKKFLTEFTTEKWVDGNCVASYPVPELLELYFDDVTPLSLKTFGIWKRKQQK